MRRTSCLLLVLTSTAVWAQPYHAPVFNPVPPIAFDTSGPVIRAHTEAGKPFTVAGERGVILGLQDGTLETWLLPMKLLSHLTIEADVENYTVPIDVNQQSAEIEVRPDRTVITYSHIAFTVRQIMFSPSGTPAGTGPVVLFQFDCLHPTDFTFRFTPELRWMWPERNEGTPGVEWVAPGHNPHEVPGGFYVLHSDYPDFAAAVTIPGALPGILAPYQERPKSYPAELKLHIDPARDRGKLYPLLMAYVATVAEANTGRLGATLEKLNEAIPALYQAHDAMWKKTLASSVSIATPDKALNEAFQWAVVSIEQLKTKTIPGQSAPIGEGAGGAAPGPAGSTKPNPASDNSTSSAGADETALVAGYYDSGDSARPGFGWFFGRDALYTLYAVDGYGDFSLSRSELEFLIHRQRADGKIMHEWSQTAAAIDWRQFSYMYAAADSTPLFLLATLDYVRHSGDVAFLKAHRDAIEKAWKFETDPAHDSDHDGIYDNSQGTGWVESWPGGLPHQEIYLALLDQQASEAYAQIAHLLGNEAASTAAAARARDIAATIEREYYDPQKGCYAFATNPAGTPNGPVDNATTVYPALAWWSNLSSGKSTLAHGDQCLRQFATATLNTDWGLRDLSNEDKDYDGMSYHQGSVWPLFTGWAALAEYRGGQPLAGYQMLMENANLTWAQDLGAVTELLSGDFYVPFGRSTSHQLWSSAMVVTPVLRGLFGIDVDAQTKTITVNPHLPAGWDHAEVLNLQVADETTGLYVSRKADHLEIYLSPTAGGGWHLQSDMAGATIGPLEAELSKKLKIPPHQGLRIPLPAMEIDGSAWPFAESVSDGTSLANRPPLPGARTAGIRILNSEYAEHQLTLTAEGLAGTDGVVSVIRRGHLLPKIQTEPASDPTSDKQYANLSYRGCDADSYACKWMPLLLHFPPGEGWKTITVTLTW